MVKMIRTIATSSNVRTSTYFMVSTSFLCMSDDAASDLADQTHQEVYNEWRERLLTKSAALHRSEGPDYDASGDGSSTIFNAVQSYARSIQTPLTLIQIRGCPCRRSTVISTLALLMSNIRYSLMSISLSSFLF